MQRLQEAAHAQGYDYFAGSPHLKHRRLYEALVARLRVALRSTTERGLPPTMLEIGAGHGGFVEPVLASGWRVTATEMSRPTIAALQERYGTNPNFTAAFDADGSLAALVGRRFSLILCASVLHHIPDYLETIETAIIRHLEPGGAFVSFQDPLWYPSLARGTHLLSRAAYLWWRLGQGNYVRGVGTRLRRLRGVYDEANPSDMVEYHVVRRGVDQRRIVERLATRFERVSLIPYWSTPSDLWQRAGSASGLKNTFAVVALGCRGHEPVPARHGQRAQRASSTSRTSRLRSVVSAPR
jgi:SAM-dependent methyltransferase